MIAESRTAGEGTFLKTTNVVHLAPNHALDPGKGGKSPPDTNIRLSPLETKWNHDLKTRSGQGLDPDQETGGKMNHTEVQEKFLMYAFHPLETQIAHKKGKKMMLLKETSKRQSVPK